MSQKVFRSFQTPDRDGLTWDELWQGEDNGLIACWEVGRKKRHRLPELAARVQDGELPVLEWKGGVERRTKQDVKYGTLSYLAQWQGLRGDDLDIDPSKEYEHTCSRTGMKVVFTRDASKWRGD